VIFIACGFFLGQIRTLRNYGWVANLAVWLNMLVSAPETASSLS
jgi:hypothetical protein